jgi:hypothetical protein
MYIIVQILFRNKQTALRYYSVFIIVSNRDRTMRKLFKIIMAIISNYSWNEYLRISKYK